MMLCLVTDRRRLAPDAPFNVARNRLADQIAWAANSSIDLVQVREPDLAAADLAALVSELLEIARGSPTRIVVNDRIDVALACGADGVHLRHDSVPAADVRRITPAGFLIGRSVHGVDDARSAGAVDYLIAGTVFPTIAKPARTTLLGLDGLAEVVQSSGVPVLAIGGVSADRFEGVTGAGAAGVAGIGVFIDWFETRNRPF